MESEDYIKKWLEGTLSDDEKKEFSQRQEYQDLENLSSALNAFRAPHYSVEEQYKLAHAKKMKGGDAKVVTMPWLKPLLRVAAVLLVTAGAYFVFLSTPSATVKTLASQNQELLLPDSSKVILNAVSQISFHEGKWSFSRQVELEGEAFFKVKKGSRFNVRTETGTVSVLGTQFNVKVRADFFEVTCYEGLVEVSSLNATTQLPPGKVFRIIKGKAEFDRNTSERTAPWLSNESSFESVPFSEVVAEFERQYSVSITLKNVNIDQLFTGRFVHHNISLAIKSITIPLNLHYQLTDDQKNVVLSGETN